VREGQLVTWVMSQRGTTGERGDEWVGEGISERGRMGETGATSKRGGGGREEEGLEQGAQPSVTGRQGTARVSR
jgi:hypothetical protein